MKGIVHLPALRNSPPGLPVARDRREKSVTTPARKSVAIRDSRATPLYSDNGAKKGYARMTLWSCARPGMIVDILA